MKKILYATFLLILIIMAHSEIIAKQKEQNGGNREPALCNIKTLQIVFNRNPIHGLVSYSNINNINKVLVRKELQLLIESHIPEIKLNEDSDILLNIDIYGSLIVNDIITYYCSFTIVKENFVDKGVPAFGEMVYWKDAYMVSPIYEGEAYYSGFKDILSIFVKRFALAWFVSQKQDNK